MGGFLLTSPWVLSALAALPVLWYILRITPPVPKRLILPTAKFLKGLQQDQNITQSAPWWILLLRLLICALVIIALARPVYNPASPLPFGGNVRMIIDNGWTSAPAWDAHIKEAESFLDRAARDDRQVIIVTTVPPEQSPPMDAKQARAMLQTLKPYPVLPDYEALQKHLEHKTHSLWFGSGIALKGFDEIAGTLNAQGGLTYLQPPEAQAPLALKRIHTHAGELTARVLGSTQGQIAQVQLTSLEGQILDQQSLRLGKDLEADITFDLPNALRNKARLIKIAGQNSAGATYILDERFQRPSVGIVGTPDSNLEDAAYYLERALSPYAALQIDTLGALLDDAPNILILPDIHTIPDSLQERLENWVKAGGLLLRFAGENMAQSREPQILTPVPLRSGWRSLDGTLNWEDAPPKLAPFAEDSPLYGVTLTEDILIKRQILADPAIGDLTGKVWAQLEDGTPLITGTALEQGQLVMIHTSAAPDWSNFALSGTYIDVLRRIMDMAGAPPMMAQNDNAGRLEPLWVLDGFGRVQAPDDAVKPLDIAQETRIGTDHPPGLYAQAHIQRALNIGDEIIRLRPVSGVTPQIYGQSHERALMPVLLYMALLLFLTDWLISLLMRHGIARRFAVLLLLLMPLPAQAQSFETTYANALHLAYVRTGDAALDTLSGYGLQALANELNRRTSANIQGVAAVDITRDTLAFFPLLYWPVSAQHTSLSEEAQRNIQSYLDHGGTILFDTRHLGGNQAQLRMITQNLSIPPLAPIKQNHVLGKSFYLLDRFVGRYDDGTLWVESQSASGRDEVSSVILGNNDWASIWADEEDHSRKREMAIRFGVNLVMYTLTGNYKADQVHVKQILERLGR